MGIGSKRKEQRHAEAELESLERTGNLKRKEVSNFDFVDEQRKGGLQE